METILEPSFQWVDHETMYVPHTCNRKAKVFWTSESLKRFCVSSRKGKKWSNMKGLSLQPWLNGWFHLLSTSLEVMSQTHPSGLHCFIDIKCLQTWLNYSVNNCWLIQPLLPKAALEKNRTVPLPCQLVK